MTSRPAGRAPGRPKPARIPSGDSPAVPAGEGPAGRAPGRPKPARIPSGDRPTYPAGEGPAGRAPGRPKPARIPSGDRPAYPPGEGHHHPRKRFGQHFLTDTAVIDAIVGAIDPRPGEAVIEIGPGLGALTRPLLERCAALTAIELDRDLARRLRGNAALNVVEADVLEVDFAALAAAAGRKLRIVGNLPYNISTPILFHLLDFATQVHDQHFMLQREVACRMAAAPGTKDFGRLSVMLQWRYRIETVLDVPPEAFEPPPRVHSAIVRMEPLPLDAGVDAERLRALVTVAFSQRRKLLRHTLGHWLAEQGVDTPFDLQRRAEEVPVVEYLALAATASPHPAPGRPGDDRQPAVAAG